MLNTIFAQIIFESKINDSAAKKLENLMKLSSNENYSPSFDEYKKARLVVDKKYLTCNNCAYFKKSKKCDHCNTETAENYFTIFDLKDQIKNIVRENWSSLMYYKKNITKLGYLPESFIAKFHEKHDGLTLTLNLDGISVFKNNSKDTWPVYLAFNELKMDAKFDIKNIALAGIWCGQTKINNQLLLEKLMEKVKQLESGVEIDGALIKIYVVFGSYDKPAKSLIYNCQTCTSINGCMFCDACCTRIGRKPVYLSSGKQRKHGSQIENAKKAFETGKPVLGMKGLSSLRYYF